VTARSTYGDSASTGHSRRLGFIPLPGFLDSPSRQRLPARIRACSGAAWLETLLLGYFFAFGGSDIHITDILTTPVGFSDHSSVSYRSFSFFPGPIIVIMFTFP